MRRLFCGTLLFLIAATTLAMADDPGDRPKFAKGVAPDAIRFVTSVSEDRHASTMLFDNFVLGTELGRPDTPDTKTKIFTYARGIESKADVVVIQDFRGYVSQDGTASVALMIHSAGKTTVVDLDKAIQDCKSGDPTPLSETHRKAKEAASDQGFTVNARPDKSEDFTVRVTTPVAAGQALQTTIILLVDRIAGDEHSGALITIDNISEVVKAKPKKGTKCKKKK